MEVTVAGSFLMTGFGINIFKTSENCVLISLMIHNVLVTPVLQRAGYKQRVPMSERVRIYFISPQ
jgi:hypothetical protein